MCVSRRSGEPVLYCLLNSNQEMLQWAYRVLRVVVEAPDASRTVTSRQSGRPPSADSSGSGAPGDGALRGSGMVTWQVQILGRGAHRSGVGTHPHRKHSTGV